MDFEIYLKNSECLAPDAVMKIRDLLMQSQKFFVNTH